MWCMFQIGKAMAAVSTSYLTTLTVASTHYFTTFNNTLSLVLTHRQHILWSLLSSGSFMDVRSPVPATHEEWHCSHHDSYEDYIVGYKHYIDSHKHHLNGYRYKYDCWCDAGYVLGDRDSTESVLGDGGYDEHYDMEMRSVEPESMVMQFTTMGYTIIHVAALTRIRSTAMGSTRTKGMIMRSLASPTEKSTIRKLGEMWSAPTEPTVKSTTTTGNRRPRVGATWRMISTCRTVLAHTLTGPPRPATTRWTLDPDSLIWPKKQIAASYAEGHAKCLPSRGRGWRVRAWTTVGKTLVFLK